MSLVDYASSEEDEPEVREGEKDSKVIRNEDVPKDDQPAASLSRNLSLGSSSDQNIKSALHQSEPSELKLPDASLLLNSPDVPSHLMHASDHSSRVAAAMAESASRKRDSIGMASIYPRSKVPRGTLPHSRSVPDTVGGLLAPPQLSGRSNIVTEDLGKLFVKRQVDPSSN